MMNDHKQDEIFECLQDYEQSLKQIEKYINKFTGQLGKINGLLEEEKVEKILCESDAKLGDFEKTAEKINGKLEKISQLNIKENVEVYEEYLKEMQTIQAGLIEFNQGKGVLDAHIQDIRDLSKSLNQWNLESNVFSAFDERVKNIKTFSNSVDQIHDKIKTFSDDVNASVLNLKSVMEESGKLFGQSANAAELLYTYDSNVRELKNQIEKIYRNSMEIKDFIHTADRVNSESNSYYTKIEQNTNVVEQQKNKLVEYHIEIMQYQKQIEQILSSDHCVAAGQKSLQQEIGIIKESLLDIGEKQDEWKNFIKKSIEEAFLDNEKSGKSREQMNDALERENTQLREQIAAIKSIMHSEINTTGMNIDSLIDCKKTIIAWDDMLEGICKVLNIRRIEG